MNKNIILWMVTFVLISGFVYAADSQSVYFNAGDKYDGSNRTSFEGLISDDGSWTIAVDLRLDSLGTTRAVYGPRSSGSPDKYEGVLYANTANKLTFYSDAGDGALQTATGVSSGEWTRVLITVAGGNKDLYTNTSVGNVSISTANGADYVPGRYLAESGLVATKWIGYVYDYTEWDKTLNATEIANYLNCGETTTCVVPSVGNFTIEVTDKWDDSAINNVTANLTLDNGTNYIFTNTTGNIIKTTIPVNVTDLANITITNLNYFDSIYIGVNVSTTLSAKMNQSQIKFNASNIFGDLITVANFTIGIATQDQDYIWPLKAGFYNVTFSSGEFIQSTQEINISSLDNTTISFTDMFDTLLNIDAKDFVTNGSLSTFNATINQTTKSYNNFSETTSGNISIGLMKDYLYNITIRSPGYLIGYNPQYNITSNLTDYLHSSTSRATFIDGNTTSPIPGRDITIVYPGGFVLPLVTDANGSVEWVTIVNGVELYGVYNITLESTAGYDSPQSFFENITADNAPLNATYLIQPAQLNITIRDVTTSQLINQSVIVTIQGVGEFNVTGGNLVIQNGSIGPGTYTLFAFSEGYRLTQYSFEYDAREVENINVFMLNSSDPNAGNLVGRVFDEYFNEQIDVDMRLLEYNAITDSSIEVAQCFSNSNGECFFGIEIGVKSYIITATLVTADGTVLQTQSSPRGEIVFVDNYEIEMHLYNTQLFEVSELLGLFVNTINTTLVNDTSYLTSIFYDVYGENHTVCIEYFYYSDLEKLSLLQDCETGSSGVLHVINGYKLNRSYTNEVQIYVNQSGQLITYFEQVYPADTSFETLFSYRIPIFIGGIFLVIFAICLYLKLLALFGIGTYLIVPFLIRFTPSYIDWKSGVVLYIFATLLLWLTRKDWGNYSV